LPNVFFCEFFTTWIKNGTSFSDELCRKWDILRYDNVALIRMLNDVVIGNVKPGRYLYCADK